MSGGDDEMVDVKEVGNDVDETLKINLNDQVADKTVGNDVKGVVLCQETQELNENGELKMVRSDSGVDSMVDKTVVGMEEQIRDDTVDKTAVETEEQIRDDTVDKTVVEMEEQIRDDTVDITAVETEEQIRDDTVDKTVVGMEEQIRDDTVDITAVETEEQIRDDTVDKTVVEVEEQIRDDMVDKTVGNDEGDKGPSRETQESTENGEVSRVEVDSGGDDMVDKTVVEVEGRIADDMVDKTVVEGEEQSPAEKIVGIPDVKSVETSARDDDVQANVASVSNVEVDANGVHDDYFNVKLKSDGIVNQGANEVIEGTNAKESECQADVSNEKSSPKENEERQADVSNEKSSLKENEENQVDVSNEKSPSKENEQSQVGVLNEKSPPVEIEADDKVKDDENGEALKDGETDADVTPLAHIKEEMSPTAKLDGTIMNTANKSFLAELSSVDGYESGTEEEQTEFANDVKAFYRENNLEYKAPKFYKEDLNLLKLWRAVIKLGGYEQVTTCKLWRLVGESFRPPKTCTTVSWTFRIFYEKALLEYEKHKMRNGVLPFSEDSLIEPVRVENQAPGSQIALGSGRARRDAAARAMQGWHSQRLLGNGEVSQPIIKDKNMNSTLKGDKQPKTNGLLKRKKPSSGERGANVPPLKSMRLDSMVMDIGPPADWVKVNVQKTSDCYEIYALVPGLLREEVHVQSDPAGRLIISGEPEHPDNPWGVTAFKKVVTLPSRIDPHQTSAVVTLHGQLFVRVPFEQLDV